MRSKISVFLMVGFVASLCSLATLAKAEEQKAQLFVVDEHVVKPSMADEFEAVAKEWVAILTKHKFSYPCYTYQTSDFHYHFIWPFENYADLDNWEKAVDELAEKVGEPWQALMKRASVTHEFVYSHMWNHMPELSYTPESPRLKPEEGNYFFWDIYYVQSGKTKEFDEILKKLLTLFKSKNIEEGFAAYSGDIGTEMPVRLFVMGARDAADFHIHNTKMWEILGEEGDMLWKKAVTFIRKREVEDAWFLPDLSYIPEEKQTTK